MTVPKDAEHAPVRDGRMRVGLVRTEPISDPLLARALAAASVECVDIRPELGRLRTVRAIAGCDLILKSFGAYSSGYFRLFAAARAIGKRVAIYWIGSDVLHVGDSYRWGRRIQHLVNRNLVVTDGLRRELDAVGIRSTVLPIVPELDDIAPAPLPSVFSVMVYVPAHDHLMYGSDTLKQVAALVPNVRFQVVGGWVDDSGLPNLECLGFVKEMAPEYRRSSLLLRLTRHDGLPKMLLEALSYGREVVWSQPFPHARMARDAAEAVRWVRHAQEARRLNIEGASYVRANFSFAQFAKSLAREIRAICDE